MTKYKIRRRVLLFYTADIALVTASFLLFIWIKPASLRFYLPYYFEPFLVFLGIWLAASIPSNKYAIKGKETLNDFIVPVFFSGLITLCVITIMIAGFQWFQYSRMIVFGTILLSGFLETILFSLFYYYRKLNRFSDNNETVHTYLKNLELHAIANENSQVVINEPVEHVNSLVLENFKSQILEETNEDVYNFLCGHINSVKDKTILLSTTTQFNILSLPQDTATTLVNLKPINDIKRINKFFEAVNTRLPEGGLFIDCVITNEIKKKHILHIYPAGLNYVVYFVYFIYKRVFPKVPGIKKIYFFLTNGYDRAISKAEAFGRLYSCGFEVLADESIGNYLYFVARKATDPSYDMNPTYGPLISLKRIGRNGRIIHVYKFRTMHPYSEYIQEYVFRKNDLQDGGKFKDDFRISTTGRIMRKLWIDELPMLFNLLIGDLKLVGVRPLSNHYFSLYTPELQARRKRFRPGLIPPFYADMPVTLDEIMASEMRYLDLYEKSPLLTDIRYFGKAFYNIVIKRRRSG